MRIACIDIGTNSIRLLLAVFEDGKFSEVHRELEMTRLGYKVNETRLLDSERMRASVEVIDAYYKKAVSFGAESIFMMATSAVRDSKNANMFDAMVKNRTGQSIDIIPGELEAEVGFKGVLLGSKTEGNLLIIDIGGGSTELILGDRTGIKYAVSLNIGAVRLTGAYVNHDPISCQEVQKLREVVSETISHSIEELLLMPIDSVVGIGGTATTYATMVHSVDDYTRDKVHGLYVSLDTLALQNSKLEKMNNEDKLHITGLDPKRADIIYAGGIILEELLTALKIEGYFVSDFDNLEGFSAYKIEQMNS
ncbi:MAG: hypothetical protein BGO41_15485 [Clostridiales bacterium 38-18]|nr:MAG: hypothetical protein BGO41_15485 [Clostridiales bacterium 38-18]